jgi:hypothetical protein
MNKQNDCHKRREAITAFALGELEHRAADELKKHIDTCETCRSLYHALADEEKTIHSAFKAIADRSEGLQSSLIEQFAKHEPTMALTENEARKTTRIMWKTVMKSRIVKLTAAAVIILAVLIVINQFGGSIDGATMAFAQITENMKTMPWMHAVVEGAGERLEAWFSFERRVLFQRRVVMVNKRVPREIRYHDGLKQTVQIYDPDANTITISYTTADALAGLGHSPLDFPKSILKVFDEAGEKIIQETGKYKGKDSKIYKMSGFFGGMDMKVEMIVDRDKNVLLFINQKVFDKAGTLKMEANAYFDYPENGPNNIYEVGAPTSAKIVSSEKEKTAYEKAFEKAITVIDNRENWPEPRDLVVAYWKDRNAKNYDKIEIFWPGSATWNRQVLENEEPVEYVFGEIQATEIEGHIIVPYATKGYYEKHGKYSLKMWLDNKKSTKGRYYITSGN